MNPNLYDVLDVDRTASSEEIQAAWKAAIADLGPTDRRFRVYNQAAETLLDPAKRRAYDADLEAKEGAEDSPADDVPAEPPTTPSTPAVSADAAPVTTSTTSDTGSRVRWVVPTWLLIGVAVLLVLAAASTVYLFTQPSAASVESGTSSARTAAETAIEPLLSYDYRTLDQDQRDAEKYLTGRYRQKYDDLFSLIKQNAPSTKTVVTARVIDSAVVRAGADRAQILLFVDQSRTNARSKTPTVFKNQATVTMQKVGGQWLVDGIATSPGSQ